MNFRTKYWLVMSVLLLTSGVARASLFSVFSELVKTYLPGLYLVYLACSSAYWLYMFLNFWWENGPDTYEVVKWIYNHPPPFAYDVLKPVIVWLKDNDDLPDWMKKDYIISYISEVFDKYILPNIQ